MNYFLAKISLSYSLRVLPKILLYTEMSIYSLMRDSQSTSLSLSTLTYNSLSFPASKIELL